MQVHFLSTKLCALSTYEFLKQFSHVDYIAWTISIVSINAYKLNLNIIALKIYILW